MRTEKIKRNDVVRRFDGAIYIVTETTEKQVELSPAEVCDDGSYAVTAATESQKLTVPAKTCGHFFAVIEASEPDIPDLASYTVEDGVLFKDGVAIDLGSITVKKVMGACRGHLLLAVIPRKMKEKEALADFSIETGKVFMVSGAHDAFSVIDTSENGFIVIIQDTEKVNYRENDEIKEGQTLYRACSVIREKYGRLDSYPEYTAKEGSDIGEYEIFKDGNDILLVFSTNRTFKVVELEDGEIEGVVLPELGRNNATIFRICEKGVKWSYIAPFDGAIKKIIPCPDGENVVFVTDLGIVHSNVGHFYRQAVGKNVLKAVEEHPLPLGIQVPNEQKTIFTFGNPDSYGTAVITVEKSHEDDSGFHTEVEYF